MKKNLRVRHLFWFFLMFFYSVFCFSGCVPKDEWVLRCGPYFISSGEYNFLLVTTLLNANAKLKNSKGDMENVDFDLRKLQNSYIEKQPAMDWVQKEAQKRARRWIVVQIEYDKNNLGSSAEVSNKLKSVFSQNFDGQYADLNRKLNFSKYGCTKKTLQDASLKGFKLSTLLAENFAKGKPLHYKVDDVAVQKFINANFLKFKIIKIFKNVNNSAYSKMNDSKAGSKLSTMEGVNTPQELVKKYMDELKNSGDIDEIGKRYAKLTGSTETEIKPKIVYQFSDNKTHDSVDPEVKGFVRKMKPGSEPVLKENENFYFILQRYDLDENDVKSQNEKASKILSTNVVEEFLNKYENDYKNKIKVNSKMIRKYSAEKMAKRIAKYKPKADKNKSLPF